MTEKLPFKTHDRMCRDYGILCGYHQKHTFNKEAFEMARALIKGIIKSEENREEEKK